MSTKGYRREKQLADIHEQHGYKTFRPPRTQYGEQDMFNLFDLVVFHDGISVWTQVKANDNNLNISGFFEQAEEILPMVHHYALYAICYDRQGWRLIERVPGGYDTFVDEREIDCAMGEGVSKWLEGDL